MNYKHKKKIQSMLAFGMAILVALIPTGGSLSFSGLFTEEAQAYNSPVRAYYYTEDLRIYTDSVFDDEHLVPSNAELDDDATYYVVAGLSEASREYLLEDDSKTAHEYPATGIEIKAGLPNLALVKDLPINITVPSGSGLTYKIEVDGEDEPVSVSKLVSGTKVDDDSLLYVEFDAPVSVMYTSSYNTISGSETSKNNTLRHWKLAIMYSVIAANGGEITLIEEEAPYITVVPTHVNSLSATKTDYSADSTDPMNCKYYVPFDGEDSYNLLMNPDVGCEWVKISTVAKANLPNSEGVGTLAHLPITHDILNSLQDGKLIAKAQVALEQPTDDIIISNGSENKKRWYKNDNLYSQLVIDEDVITMGRYHLYVDDRYELYYTFADKDTNEISDPDAATWVRIDSPYEIPIADLGVGSGESDTVNLFLRYSNGTDSDSRSGMISAPIEIGIDNKAPSAKITKIDANKKTVSGSSEYWTSGTADITLTITEEGSGIDPATLKYAYTDNNDEDNPPTDLLDGTIEDGKMTLTYDPNDPNMKSDYLYMQVSDRVGNIYSHFFRISQIKYDAEAPENLENGVNVKYYTSYGTASQEEVTAASLGMNHWQTEPVTIVVTPTDRPADGSGIKKVVFTDQGNTHEVTEPDTDGNYIYNLSDGKHAVYVTAYDYADNPGNELTQIIWQDTEGITNQQLVLNPQQSAYKSSFRLQAKAESLSGIQKITVVYYENGTVIDGGEYEFPGTDEIRKSGNVYSIEQLAPQELLDQKKKLTVSVTFQDACGRKKTVTSTEFAFNSQGTGIIYENTDESWQKQDITVPIRVTDSTGFQSVTVLVNDSPVDAELKSNTDDNTERLYQITLSENSVSTGTKVSVVVVNNVNDTTRADRLYYLDKQAPKLSLSGINNNAIYNTDCSLSITVDENIWDQAAVTATASRVLNGETIAVDLGNFTLNSDSSAFSRVFKEEGTYHISISVKDAAGNSDRSSISFIIDKTAPDTLNRNNLKYYTKYSPVNLETDNVEVSSITDWQTETVYVVAAAKDSAGADGNGTGIDRVVYTDSYTGTSVTLTNGDASGNYVYQAVGDGLHRITIQVYDRAGNSTQIERTVRIDTAGIQDASLTLDPTLSAYRAAFKIKSEAVSVSGIRKITYQYRIGGKVLTDGEYEYTDAITKNDTRYSLVTDAPISLLDQKRDIVLSIIITDNCGREYTLNSGAFSVNTKGSGIDFGNLDGSWKNQNISIPITITDQVSGIASVVITENGEVITPALVSETDTQKSYMVTIQNNSSADGTVISVSATNRAGEVTTESHIYRLDKQTPVITLTGAENGSVYNQNQTVSVRVEENIWQEMKPIVISATRTLDGITTDIEPSELNANGSPMSGSRTFTEDGVYQVTVTAADAAGNEAVQTVGFTIDKTAPVLSITGAQDGAYSGNPITLNFQTVESFYETDSVTISVERRFEGAAYSSRVNFANSGKNSSVSNVFATDGEYTVVMTATDGAGNVATEQTIHFTVDVTAPIISIQGTKDYLVTKDMVSLQFSVLESYFETNQVRITGTRKDAEGNITNLNIEGWSNTARTSTLSKEFSEDGYYTITIESVDRAGNSRRQTIHFTIDTQSPVISDLSHYNGKYLKRFVLEEALEDLISELTSPTVRMTLNGAAYDGSEITEDGKYTLIIEVTDEVGLTATRTIEFIIDNTAPKVIFAGVQDGTRTTEPIRLNITLENENDSIDGITINGEQQDMQGKSSYEYSFNSFGEYMISVYTSDAAGNSNSQTISFTYAEQAKTSYLWIFIAAAVLAVMLIIGLVIVSAKKKQDQD